MFACLFAHFLTAFKTKNLARNLLKSASKAPANVVRSSPEASLIWITSQWLIQAKLARQLETSNSESSLWLDLANFSLFLLFTFSSLRWNSIQSWSTRVSSTFGYFANKASFTIRGRSRAWLMHFLASTSLASRQPILTTNRENKIGFWFWQHWELEVNFPVEPRGKLKWNYEAEVARLGELGQH